MTEESVNASRASPVLQAEEIIEVVAHEWSNLLEVMCPDTGGQQGLVGISEGSVHQ